MGNKKGTPETASPRPHLRTSRFENGMYYIMVFLRSVCVIAQPGECLRLRRLLEKQPMCLYQPRSPVGLQFCQGAREANFAPELA